MATFCLIHGNWHDGSCWSPVVEGLRARGHDAVTPDLPFDDPAATGADRARPAIAAIANVEGPVVVVAHSVGSAEGALVAAECDPLLLVYLCPRFGSFAAPDDAPPVFREGFPFPPRDAQGRIVWDPDAAIAAMYPRLPEETARRLAQRLRPGAVAAGEYPLAEHPDVPTALILASYDEFFTPEWERFVARELLGIEPIEIPTGHFPMVEDPALLTDLLDRLALEASKGGEELPSG
ncbi:MAG TPA: alpha/beta hydrolase [Gaiellaceae bacterium]|nr:alpha/beta hydrolase [Gaiellaceae bacterium]